MKRAMLLFLVMALSGCAEIREHLIRNNYLSSGRAPEEWVPKKSLCPDFARNGWQDHPPAEDGCWAPPAKVGERDSEAPVTKEGFVRCVLIQETTYHSDDPSAIPQRPLLIYRCERADGTAQNFYRF